MFMNIDTPRKQGLYDPSYEHDACGIGLITNIKGVKSHKIVKKSLDILMKLEHRGGSGSEENTGDGAGILTQIPDKFFKKECARLGFPIPKNCIYGVGMLFLPQCKEHRQTLLNELEQILYNEGQSLLGYRTVPFCDENLGSNAKKSMPYIMQIFIKSNSDIKTSIDFERKLFVIRKQIESFSENSGKKMYIASMSSKTIVYKGMLTPEQLSEFYNDLREDDFESAIALVHSRFSTNTFPSWERAHPNRYLIHNGEINTIRGNVNWMNANQGTFKDTVFNTDIKKVLPVIDQSGSDSSMFDNAFEFLHLAGRDISHVAMMMIPEPWSRHKTMDKYKKAFYEYHSCLMEPWDGPAAMAFTDGEKVGAVLDRNGLRPSRYYVTKDGFVILSSEVGVLNIEESEVLYKQRLRPGRMLLIDTMKGTIINDSELKDSFKNEYPYDTWLEENLVDFDNIITPTDVTSIDKEQIVQLQKSFGYTYEDLSLLIAPMAKNGEESIGSMGIDSPLAVLLDKPQNLFNYFKQLFAQVTNPPIDAIREELVISTETYIGSQSNILKSLPQNCRQIKLKTPVIDNLELEKLKKINLEGFKSTVLPILFDSTTKGNLEISLNELFKRVDSEISNGANIIILSDRNTTKDKAAIPSLLAVSALHQHLIKTETRTTVSIVLESGEPREVHHFALLLGYGVSAINPYLAIESIKELKKYGLLDIEDQKAVDNYLKASTKGIIKILSKMGISTIQSYQGSQIFEAIGINTSVINKYFKHTPSRIEGITIETIEAETLKNHFNGFNVRGNDIYNLDSGGSYKWRKDGEYHLYNPETIHTLQSACKNGSYEEFKNYSRLINVESTKASTLRGLMEFNKIQASIPIDGVEPIESIVKRFKTGAMSFGSISKEAHQTMAIAMNRLKGKSNSGEGGEDDERYTLEENGDSRSSAIKQVASGRFGVTSNYLCNAKELQIKMAQGAKPGEGGQLPASKVYPWIAKERYSTPGVGLISPPPHHDIYSIEDLAELIHDLKNANRDAKINVKLVSEIGVGTIAAGVAKGKADIILISGYDGGTGAAPRTSVKHTGLPWELGLSEANQTLLLNNLRSRVVLETDGKLLTGRDVAIAALLGAEEFGFATGPLVTLGCVMMRVCNLDTCPVGIATQNPELRKKFNGKPEYVINFMNFIAQELREYMALLGFRTINEMVGRNDLLKTATNNSHWKSKYVDLSKILFRPNVPDSYGTYCSQKQDHCLEKSFDLTKIIDPCKKAIENKEKISLDLYVKNTDRVVGTILGSEVTKKYGTIGLPDDTITLNLKGSAGQSLGAFLPRGITINLEGDSNDYTGKGLSGGKLIIKTPAESTFEADENIISGNVALYGATSGESYINGIAGERFCVRNSGATAVVEGVGDHGCEYMTGGKVIVLGKTGRNFAAGMSGGIAYIYNEDGKFLDNLNTEMVNPIPIENTDEIHELKKRIQAHLNYTGSKKASNILDSWDKSILKFIKILPIDYGRMLHQIEKVKSLGISDDEALMKAFEENCKIE